MLQGVVEIVFQVCFEGVYWILEKRYGQAIACLVLFSVVALIVLGIAMLVWASP
ncbi:hypothetical protein HZY97_11180 [Sphingomonas sp. R-74633]|uniref:hypothetical protein n=1 Tax=Sphingomonas sp. R-74633 TaxID=2751188 RepID=UPI0015D1AA7F|nr:hypothetical protein [Sphingomonas sp. R-74633]NYT41323.1 hypothetical protein [Sphingomonas sp. R-74633]